MLCQSWGGTIRIFPAVPDAWADVTLHDFRTQGAFQVSAVRRRGVTRFVRVRSLAGEPCRVRHSIPGPVTVDGARHRDVGGGVVEVDLRAGREAVIHAAGQRPDLVIAPVRITEPAQPWGLRALPPRGAMRPVDLTAVYDNDGISRDENPADGNLDGGGYTYSVLDVPPAGPLTSEAVPFVFPSGADGARNNLTGQGQAIPVPAGRYARLWMLGAATAGNVQADAVATYADGSTGTVRIALSEWIRETSFGEVELVRCTHRNHPTGRNNANPAIFQQSAALDPARSLVSLTLPRLTNPQLHLLALTLEAPV
jgi:hypothetical protein